MAVVKIVSLGPRKKSDFPLRRAFVGVAENRFGDVDRRVWHAETTWRYSAFGRRQSFPVLSKKKKKKEMKIKKEEREGCVYVGAKKSVRTCRDEWSYVGHWLPQLTVSISSCWPTCSGDDYQRRRPRRRWRRRVTPWFQYYSPRVARRACRRGTLDIAKPRVIARPAVPAGAGISI